MKGTKTDCRARVYFDPDIRLVLVCSSSLPDLEPGRDYQLWAMIDGKPVSVGVLKTRKGNAFELSAPPSVPLGKASTFAISKEPSGGMPQPTGEIVFAGL
jgi:anti-sigma-K factor RskA